MTLTNFRDTQPVVTRGEAYSKLTTTDLSNPTAASNTFKGGKKAYANKNYDKAIQSFTRTINILQRDMETALLHRAIAFEMKKRDKNAIQDTLRANPTNKATIPDPYLTMANTLVLQDKLHEAASHLTNGLAVVPADQGQSESLSHLYQRVMSEIDRRNRWITNILPPEILDNILSLLPIKVCLQLSFTCRYWNKYIMREWEGMWVTMDCRELYGTRPLGHYDAFVSEKMLKSIPANRIRFVLEGSARDDESISTEVIKAAQRHSWNKIEYLGVVNPRGSGFLEVLRQNKNSIKAVELWDYEPHYSYSELRTNGYCRKKVLMDAARTCTSMRSISIYHNRCQSVPIITQLPSSNNLVLTHLKLMYSSSSFRTPKNHYDSYTRTLCLINNQCPMLQELIFDTLNGEDDDLKLTYSPASFDSKLVSLGMTIPGTNNRPCNVQFNQQIHLLTTKSRQTLQTLKLCVTKPSSPQDCDLLLVFAEIGLPALTNLDFSITSPPQNFRLHNLRYLITACPALERVRIHGGGIWNASVMEELSNLSSLRHLDIYMGHCSNVRNTYSGKRSELASLLEKTTRTLRTFSFGYTCHQNDLFCHCDIIKPYRHLLTEVCEWVATSSIQELDISKGLISFTEDLKRIIGFLKDSQIRTLTIKVTRMSFGKPEIEAIASLRNVSFLKIYDLEDYVNEKQLIQIFNEHKKGKPDLFAVWVCRNRDQRAFSGRKQYPIAREDHLRAGKIKNEKYLKALYAIKEEEINWELEHSPISREDFMSQLPLMLMGGYY